MPKRILIVEDDPPVRRVVKTILKREGYTIDEAADGEEALTKVKADNYGGNCARSDVTQSERLRDSGIPHP